VPNRRDTNNLARGERLQIMLSPDELTAVDDFRFKHRMPSRAAAVRELFRIGLASTGSVHNGEGKKSSDMGVLEDGAAGGKPISGLRMVPKDGAGT
jgi:hypothetical protein